MTLYNYVYVDLSGTGTLAETEDNISAYVQTVNVSGGLTSSDEHVAKVGRCTVTLNNESRIFSPENTLGTYYGDLVPLRKLRWDVSDGITTWTRFTGYVQSWKPESGHIHGNRRCRLIATDAMDNLQRAKIRLPAQEYETAATVLTKLCAVAFDGGLAEADVTFADTISDSDTVTVGGRVYTFVDTLSGDPDEVLISVGTDTEDETSVNFAAAINLEAGEGTLYGNGTLRHEMITADHTPGLGNWSGDVTGWIALNDVASSYDVLVQSFKLRSDFTVSTVSLYLRKVGTPTGKLTAGIYTVTDAGPQLPETLLASGTADEADVTAGGGWITFTLSDSVELPLYRKLYVTLVSDHADSAVNYIEWAIDATPGSFAWQGEAKTFAGGMGAYVAVAPAAVYITRFCGAVELAVNARGAWGNALTLSTDSSGLTVSGATFSGGSDEPAGLMDFDTGPTFPLAAANWDSTRTPGTSAVRDVVESAYGLFWVAEDGTLTFRDFEYAFKELITTASITLDNEMDAIEASVSADDIFNIVEMEYTPARELDTGVLARAAGGIKVQPRRRSKRHNVNSTLTYTTVAIPALDDTGQHVGIKSVIHPVAGTDYTVYSKPSSLAGDVATYQLPTGELGPQPKGKDVTDLGRIAVSLALGGGGIEATFSNDSYHPLYVRNFQVRGEGWSTYDARTATARDETSIATYGERTLNLEMPIMIDPWFAEAIVKYELNRRKDPHTWIDKVSFKGTTEIGGVNLWSVNVGDVVSLSDTQTGLSAVKVMVLGIRGSNAVDGKRDLTWIVKRMDAQPTWILENATYSVLETTTRLSL
jgi:hypothetical protein